MSKAIEYDENDSSSSSEDDYYTSSSSEDEGEQKFITNNISIKEKKFSYFSLFMYLCLIGGAVLFIVTASLDPRESTNLYITAGVLLGVAFFALMYIYR